MWAAMCEDGTQRCVGWCADNAEVANASSQGTGRTFTRMATGTVCDDFTAFAVFLIVEGDGGLGGTVQVGEWTGEMV